MVQRKAQYKHLGERERESGLEVVPFCYQACKAAIELLLHLPNDGFQFRDFFSQASQKNTNGVSNDKKSFCLRHLNL